MPGPAVNSPTTINTEFGWVLARTAGSQEDTHTVTTNLTSVITGNDLICRFWEVEEMIANSTLTLEERSAFNHFETHRAHDDRGRFIVPFPKPPCQPGLENLNPELCKDSFPSNDSYMRKNSFLTCRRSSMNTLSTTMLRKFHHLILRSHFKKISIFPFTWFTRSRVQLPRFVKPPQPPPTVSPSTTS